MPLPRPTCSACGGSHYMGFASIAQCDLERERAEARRIRTLAENLANYIIDIGLSLYDYSPSWSADEVRAGKSYRRYIEDPTEKIDL